ncbi:MAG: M14 family zinc carboxypeptidase [Christensenellaceae bacterium]
MDHCETCPRAVPLRPGAGSVWIVPLMNPDGALLSQCGLSSVADGAARERLLRINGGEDFSLWKANGAGVDLNVNFDADWGEGKRNVRAAASENYIGPEPFSEPETRALKAFTEEIRPDYTLSYHTKGGEIYWYYYQPLSACVRDKSWRSRFRRRRDIPFVTRQGARAAIRLVR